MEFLSPAWWSSLVAIVLIDLVLAGDNAIVIALAARGVPKPLQRRAIVWGTVGAVIVRTLMTIGVVWLLRIPGLMAMGGAALVYVAWKLLSEQDEGSADPGEHGATTFWGAMRTIVVADALMGIDNVLGVAGAAQGSIGLVIAGLLISIPIVVLGSSVVLRLVERYPGIIYLGAGVLAFTAAKMIVNEPWQLKAFFATSPLWYWGFVLLVIVVVLGTGWWSRRRANRRHVPEINARLAQHQHQPPH